MNRAICNQAQTFQKGFHCRSTKRTVQANREWVAVLGRDIKSFRGLSGEIATTGIYNSTGKNDRKLTLMFFRPLFDRKESCFGIQSIKDRLHLQKMSKKKKMIKYHQNINTTFNQGIHLFIIALHLMESRRKEVQEYEFVKRNVSFGRIFDIGRDTSCLVCRPHTTSSKTRTRGIHFCVLHTSYGSQKVVHSIPALQSCAALTLISWT